MRAAIFSYKGLAIGWAGLLAGLGAGALALQVTTPPPAPQRVAAATPPAIEAAPAVQAPAPTPAVVAAPAPPAIPFENHSLLAMLPPPSWHPAPRLAPPLPLPPVPPPRRVARAQPRREVAVAAAAPADERAEWDRGMPYPGLYARSRAYDYAGPRTYYGW